jgi:hypothetical protein
MQQVSSRRNGHDVLAPSVGLTEMILLPGCAHEHEPFRRTVTTRVSRLVAFSSLPNGNFSEAWIELAQATGPTAWHWMERVRASEVLYYPAVWARMKARTAARTRSPAAASTKSTPGWALAISSRRLAGLGLS